VAQKNQVVLYIVYVQCTKGTTAKSNVLRFLREKGWGEGSPKCVEMHPVDLAML